MTPFPMRFGNERDAEVPLFLEFLERVKPTSLLDVGAHYTHAYYAKEAKAIMGPWPYRGIDLAMDLETAKVLDQYIVGDFMREDRRESADAVSCISTLEHFGAPLPQSYIRSARQYSGAVRIFETARRAAFLTFPFGLPGWIPDHYSNITDALLWDICETGTALGFSMRSSFYASETPQSGGWAEVSHEAAHVAPLRADKGVECICVLEAMK